MQVAIEGEWQRREREKGDRNGTMEDPNLDINEQTVDEEASSQPTSTNSANTSSGGSQSHATRALLSPGGVHVVVDIPKDASNSQMADMD